jgi:hypothetical protein
VHCKIKVPKHIKAIILTKAFVLLFLAISAASYGQVPVSCQDLKNGIFYYYQKNSPDHFLIYRMAETQKEINLTTGDTTVWKIDWQNDCNYSLKFQSSSTKRPPETVKLLKEHTLVYAVLKLAEDYYTFKGSVDNIANQQIIADTIWLKEKTTFTNTELFKRLRNEREAGKLRDTSKYAILYVYRPGKITNSLGNYFVYFDNVLMCVASNNSGYVFKVLKEGPFQVSSKLYKDEASVNLDIQFGKTYFVKSMIHWGISSRLYNFKLEMANVPPEQGQNEFENIKNK